MKTLRIAASILLAALGGSLAGAVIGLAILAWTPRPVAAAVPACTWGEPGWGVHNDAWGVSTSINVGCNGGITRCSGRLDISYWIYDEAEGDWIAYFTEDREWYSVYTSKACGENYLYTEYTPVTWWPPGTYCCTSLEWRVYDGYKYNLARWRDNVFETP